MKNILRDYQNDAHFSTGLVKQIAKANWCDFSSKQWKKLQNESSLSCQPIPRLCTKTQSFKFLEPSIAWTLVKQTSSII